MNETQKAEETTESEGGSPQKGDPGGARNQGVNSEKSRNFVFKKPWVEWIKPYQIVFGRDDPWLISPMNPEGWRRRATIL